MAVSDKKVREIYESALQRNAAKGKGSPQICAAFGELYNQRNDPNDPQSSLDEDLDAAEHDRLSRCWVVNGTYSVSQMKTWVKMYGSLKEYGLVPRSNPNKPHAPWSSAQAYWGLKGADDGEKDFNQHPPSKQPGWGEWYSPPQYY